MAGILLDSNILIALIFPNEAEHGHATQIAAKARKRSDPIYASTISLWEIAARMQWPASANKPEVSIETILATNFPVDGFVNVTQRLFRGLRGRPIPEGIKLSGADRIIVACAHAKGATLVTADNKLIDAANEYFGVPAMTPGTYVGLEG
jgi:PIN domain nuclease of toxin-antitoxin system